MHSSARTLPTQHRHCTTSDPVRNLTPSAASAPRALTVSRLARTGLCAVVLSFMLQPLLAQERGLRTADIVGKSAAAKRLLFTVGHWTSQDDGVFYFQFRANGTYTYTHIDPTKVTRVQQAGRFDVRAARLADERWPGVDLAGADPKKNRGFQLVLDPAAIEVAGSDPQGLPGDEPSEYRLTLTLPPSGSSDAPSFAILSDTLPPDSAFGRLTFRPGP